SGKGRPRASGSRDPDADLPRPRRILLRPRGDRAQPAAERVRIFAREPPEVADPGAFEQQGPGDAHPLVERQIRRVPAASQSFREDSGPRRQPLDSLAPRRFRQEFGCLDARRGQPRPRRGVQARELRKQGALRTDRLFLHGRVDGRAEEENGRPRGAAHPGGLAADLVYSREEAEGPDGENGKAQESGQGHLEDFVALESRNGVDPFAASPGVEELPDAACPEASQKETAEPAAVAVLIIAQERRRARTIVPALESQRDEPDQGKGGPRKEESGRETDRAEARDGLRHPGWSPARTPGDLLPRPDGFAKLRVEETHRQDRRERGLGPRCGRPGIAKAQD